MRGKWFIVPLLLLCLSLQSAHGAVALVTSTTARSTNSNGFTSSGINTTGANLIVVGVVRLTGVSATLSDSKGNTYTAGTETTGVTPLLRLYYCASPVVGTGHTFTVTSTGAYPAIAVLAFSGASTSPADLHSEATSASGNTIQPGSITPSENSCVLVTAVGSNSNPQNIDNGFTAVTIDPAGGAAFGIGIAHKIQTTATAVNPTWTSSGQVNASAVMASFKATAVKPLPPFLLIR